MVRLDKIYTRGGDAGQTHLGDGSRVDKTDPRIAAMGAVDETSSAIGIARLDAEGDMDAMLGRIQNDLFDLGADLCTPETIEPPPYEPLRMIPAQVIRLETEIDQLNDDLSPLNSFVLPGGTAAAAHLHLARTICRRAERIMVELALDPEEKIGANALRYINRLSDFLFVASRYVNGKGAGDVLWVPGATR